MCVVKEVWLEQAHMSCSGTPSRARNCRSTVRLIVKQTTGQLSRMFTRGEEPHTTVAIQQQESCIAVLL